MEEKERIRRYVLAKIDKIENYIRIAEEQKIRIILIKQKIELEIYYDFYRFLTSK